MDFKSLVIEISLTNTTTQTEFQGEAPTRLVELADQGAVLEVPSRCCAKGHYVIVDFRIVKANKSVFQFASTAKVDDHKALGDGVDRIAVTLSQFDIESWKQFRGTFSLRQEQINQFMKAARGW
jgi:hypothetical protein